MKNRAQILIVEDELPIRKVLIAGLKNSYDIIEAATGKEALQAFKSYNPDLIILDLGLPDMGGLEIVQQVRNSSKLPILVLSARGQEQDKVQVLDAGADDYLTKPFVMGELTARIRVALRHAIQQKNPEASLFFESGLMKIDYTLRQVFLGQEEIKLTPIEYRLLTLLANNAGKVVTHQQMLTEVWGAAFSRETPYLRVYMGHLRQKLKDDPSRPTFIATEPGVGYRLKFLVEE